MSYDVDLEYGDRQMIATFGRPVRLPSHGLAEHILAIFDDPYGRTDIPGGGFIQGQVITLTAITAEINGLAKRDVLAVSQKLPDGTWGGWTDYNVREVQPDGAGLTVIYLDPVTTSKNSEDEIY